MVTASIFGTNTRIQEAVGRNVTTPSETLVHNKKRFFEKQRIQTCLRRTSSQKPSVFTGIPTTIKTRLPANVRQQQDTAWETISIPRRQQLFVRNRKLIYNRNYRTFTVFNSLWVTFHVCNITPSVTRQRLGTDVWPRPTSKRISSHIHTPPFF